MHNQWTPSRPRRGGSDDGFHGKMVPNDFIPASETSVTHRSIYVPLEIAQLDTRVTRLEVITEKLSARLDEHKVEFRDFRAEMNARFDKVDDRFEKIEDRIDKFEAKVDDRFEKFEAKIDDRFEKFEAKIDSKFDRVDAKFDRVDARFEEVGIKARSDFHLLFGSLIASTLGLAGMMAKGFGWF
jgi:predicted nuclease with TOPRIM domain